jgi:sortase (surface protein transpeptidase)
MLDASGAELGRPTGVVLAAGHVDDEDGRLSPWAELHRLEPCMEIALADAHGRVHRYAVTDLYTVPQNDVTKEDIFRTSGLPELVMVTCSGPSVRDAGGAFRFAYSHNLIVRAQPIGR